MAKENKSKINYYSIHVTCSNCGWDTQKVQKAWGRSKTTRNFSVKVPMGVTTKQFLETHKCMMCQCIGTCKSKGWTVLEED